MGFEFDKDKKVLLLKVCAVLFSIAAICLTVASLLMPNWLLSDSPAGSDPKSIHHHKWGVLLSERFDNSSLLNNITVDQSGGYGAGFGDFPSPMWAATACLQCSCAAFMFFSAIATFISHWRKDMLFHSHVFSIGALVTGLASLLLFAAGLNGQYNAAGYRPIPGQNKTEDVTVLITVCPDGARFDMGECEMGLGYIIAIMGVVCVVLAIPALVTISVWDNEETSSKDKSKYRGYA